MSKEGYCCTCGKNTIKNYKPKINSINSSTMCDECIEETANYCCKCKTDLKKINTSMVLCEPCFNNTVKEVLLIILT